MIWYNKNIIVVHPPRTGGSSFETLLRQNAVASNFVKRALFQLTEPLKFESPFRLATKHLRCSQIKTIVGDKYYRKATKIGFLRNPYDRVVSHYHFGPYREINSLSGKTLSEFLEQYEPKPFENGVTMNDYYDDEVDHFIRFENYEEDVSSICQLLSLNQPHIHETKSNRKKDWKSYYDQECLNIVSRTFREDFTRFNYKEADL